MFVTLVIWYAAVFALCVIIAAGRGMTVYAYLGHVLRTWVRGWAVWLRALGLAQPRQRVSYGRIAELERALDIAPVDRKRDGTAA
jgi:hypothetical protein